MPILPKGRTSRKLALGFGLLILVIAIITMITFAQIRQIDEKVKNFVNTEVPLEQTALQMKNNINETAISLLAFVRDMDSIDERELMASEISFEESVDEFNTLSPSDEIKQAGSKLALKYEGFKDSVYEVMDLTAQYHIALEMFRDNIGEVDGLMNEAFQADIDANTLEGKKKLETAVEMKTGIDSTFNSIESYISEADPAMQQKALESQSHFEEFANLYRETSLSAYEESWLNTLSSNFQSTVDGGNALVTGTTDLNAQISQFEQNLNEITDYIDSEMQPLIHSRVIQAEASAKSSTAAVNRWLLILSIGGILAGGLAAWIISRGIVKSLKDMLTGIEKAGNGKLGHRLNIEAKGEFGQLALAFNRMLNDIGRSSDAVKRNEEMAWSLINAPSDAAVLIDKRGIILASNKLAAQIYDKKEEEMAGQCLYDLLPTQIMISRKLQVKEVISTGKPLHFEEEYGGMILDQQMYPVEGITGKTSRIAVFSSDITVRKLIDEVTEGLVQRNELLLRTAGEGIYGVDKEGKTIFVNPAAAQMLGYELDELIGKNHHEIVHHTKPDGTPYPPRECPIYAALNDGIVHIGQEELFWRKDGTSFPVAYTSKPMIENGQIVGAVVTYQDITERKHLEETLRESERKYRSIFDSVTNIILSVDLEGNIADCNNRIEKILGYRPGDVIGKPLMNIIHPDYASKARESLKNVLAKGFGYNGSYKMIHKDGTTVEVNMNIVVMKNDNGEFVRTVCMIDDINEPIQI